ncbi:uncharacterized protein LOC111639778 isoform X2 [Centruroides sculpturatus]|uniref:uncharacterized protein LOC111639778 isoform X2 n=1 Tax=Centruroides sculpturatus TaxID=218467 RepID=UPI000C6EE3F6|nr:uncharacterized protein LOC111639778 isoform X2 [Centruroides sculpturatus]
MSSSSESSECIGWTGNVGLKRDSDRKEIEKDYKKLYHQMKDENKTLKDRLKKVEVELDNTKQQLQKALQNNSRNSLSDAEKRCQLFNIQILKSVKNDGKYQDRYLLPG